MHYVKIVIACRGEYALDLFLSNWVASLGLIPGLSGFCHEIFETRPGTDKEMPLQ